MKTLSLTQGTPEWAAHRTTSFNASDCPAMLGISKYKTRSQLLHQMHTGLAPEIDAATQQRFDDGHRFEALARPIAESIIGEELYPIVGSEGKLSASFDGLTMDETTCFEHKTLSASIKTALTNGVIPAEYCAQMEQQLMISGASKCLFMASKFDGNDALIEELHCWYESDQKMRDAILQGWCQFNIDLAAYVQPEAVEKAVAAPIMQLPALFIQVEGSFNLTTNLDVFGTQLRTFVENINMTPADDQAFADAEAAVKTLEKAEALIKSQEDGALAQMGSVDEMRKTAALYLDIARTARLALEKSIKAQKLNIKENAIAKTKAEFIAHVAGLEAEIAPIKLVVTAPDFAGATKGLRGLDSLHNALSTALVNGKIAADAAARDIRIKKIWLAHASEGYEFLFNDTQTLIHKQAEDFQLAITTRITQHKQAEAAKEEATRQRIQAEADAKAQAAAQKTIDEAAKVKAEQEAMLAAERIAQDQSLMPTVPTMAEDRANQAEQIEESRKRAQLAESASVQGLKPAKPLRPTRIEMIEAIAKHFNVGVEIATDWLLTDFEQGRKAA